MPDAQPVTVDLQRHTTPGLDLSTVNGPELWAPVLPHGAGRAKMGFSVRGTTDRAVMATFEYPWNNVRSVVPGVEAAYHLVSWL